MNLVKYEELFSWLAKSDWPVIIFVIMFYLRNKKDIIGSFYNGEGGFSARKLTAFFSVVVAAKLSVLIMASKPNNELIYAWLTFGAFCLGIVTAQQVIDFKTSQPKQS